MHVGVVGAVELGDAVDDLTRLLRAGAGIEKHQTGIAVEDREFLPYAAASSPPRSNPRVAGSMLRNGAAAILLFLQLAELPAETAEQMLAHGAVLDLLDRLAQKALDQHAAGLLGRDAARAQIEQRRLVEIADRGAVAALDVVGVDFEFGLGVDDRARGR